MLSDPSYGNNFAKVEATVKKHETICADILSRVSLANDGHPSLAIVICLIRSQLHSPFVKLDLKSLPLSRPDVSQSPSWNQPISFIDLILGPCCHSCIQDVFLFCFALWENRMEMGNLALVFVTGSVRDVPMFVLFVFVLFLFCFCFVFCVGSCDVEGALPRPDGHGQRTGEGELPRQGADQAARARDPDALGRTAGAGRTPPRGPAGRQSAHGAHQRTRHGRLHHPRPRGGSTAFSYLPTLTYVHLVLPSFT